MLHNRRYSGGAIRVSRLQCNRSMTTRSGEIESRRGRAGRQVATCNVLYLTGQSRATLADWPYLTRQGAHLVYPFRQHRHTEWRPSPMHSAVVDHILYHWDLHVHSCQTLGIYDAQRCMTTSPRLWWTFECLRLDAPVASIPHGTRRLVGRRHIRYRHH